MDMEVDSEKSVKMDLAVVEVALAVATVLLVQVSKEVVNIGHRVLALVLVVQVMTLGIKQLQVAAVEEEVALM